MKSERIAAVAVGDSDSTLFSMTGRERLRAVFGRAGLPAVETPEQLADYDDVLIAHSGYAFDERVIADFARTRRSALAAEGPDGRPALVAAICRKEDFAKWSERIASEAGPDAVDAGEGATIYSAAEVSGTYNQRLRKKETPLIVRVTPERRLEIERRLFKGSYKGATDIVTKFVLPRPAFHATRAAAALGLHPNFITTLSLVLVLAAFYLFMKGEFALGLVAAWAMCFLDTVDGKLARVTHQSSRWGNLYDHGIDLVHPPFWYWAWASGVLASGELSGLRPAEVETAMQLLIAGYVLGRLIEGYFVRRFKIEIHIWRPIDYWFRHVTSRRNPNLLILTFSAVLGAPAVGLVVIAAWTVISNAFHAVRLAAAEMNASDGALKSWLAE